MTGRQFWAGLAATMLLGAAGCGGSTPASGLAQAPEFEPKDAKCSVQKSAAKPLIVEWPSADRLELETLAKQGVVVVSYAGCEMRLLSRCQAPGQYRYTAATPKEDTVSIKNSDDLWASLPMGAAELEGKLAAAGELNVAMMMVGRFTSPEPTVHQDALTGACDGATHVLSGLTVGAFDFFAGAAATVGGGAKVMGAGAGARSTSARETLTRDGDRAACDRGGEQAPPRGCASILRVEVAPLATGPQPSEPAPTAAAPAAGSGTTGTQATPAIATPEPRDVPDWVKGPLPRSKGDPRPRRIASHMDATLSHSNDAFQDCYRRFAADPKREAYMMVFIEASAAGEVTKAKFQRGTAKAPALQKCVLDIVRQVRFEVVEQPSLSSHNIHFRPK